ncbi:ABC transporter substrate-binding protein [Chloroflexota bacterium]
MKGKARSKLLLFPLVLLVMIGLIVVSCAPTPTPTPTPTPAAKPYGTFTIGLPDVGQERFLAWNTTVADAVVYQVVYETFGYPTGPVEAIPSLATGWEFTPDYRTFTMWLREGVPFQDGWGEVTADDAMYLLENLMSEECPTSIKPILLEHLDGVESIEVKDPYTLVFHQKKPSTALLDALTRHDYYVPMMCKKYVDTVGNDEADLNPIGTGPYRLVEHRFGDYLKYEALDEHWRAVPEFKNLIIRKIPEESTRIAMLRTGEIDTTIIGQTSIPEIPKEGFTVRYWPGGPHYWMMFGGIAMPEDNRYVEGYHNQDPWVDVRVREAMNIAIDREAINKAILFDTSTLMATAWPIPGWDEVKPIPYDPERAKQLLAEAGYPNGFSLELQNMAHPGVPLAPKVGEACAGYWEEIGLTVKIIPTEFPVIWPNVKDAKTAGWIWHIRYSYQPDYTINLSRWWPNGSWVIWQDAETVRICEEIDAELDQGKKDVLWRELVRYERDNYLDIPLFTDIKPIAVNDKIGEWIPNYGTYYYNYEYASHPEPLNTWRLFEPEE